MQFSTVAVLALAASSVSAWSNGTVYTTEVVTAYTTYCPASTQVTVNGQTYTVTEATTLTITNCPCTVVKPVYTTSSVYCNTCAAAATTTPYSNTTTTTAKATSSPSVVTVSGGSKALAFSGFSLAGLLGVAAYIL